MTGNTKVWRAPLAGLASVAMIATMGVAASTANAAATDYKVTFNTNGRGAKISEQPVSEGTALDTIFHSSTNPDTDPSDGWDFTGWYTSPKIGEGAKVDPATKVYSDVTLYAHWAKTKDVIRVRFNAAYNVAKYADSNQDGNHTNDATVLLAPGDKLADWQKPTDRSDTDHKVITGFKVSGKDFDFTAAPTKSENVSIAAGDAQVVHFVVSNSLTAATGNEKTVEVPQGDAVTVPNAALGSGNKLVDRWRITGLGANNNVENPNDPSDDSGASKVFPSVDPETNTDDGKLTYYWYDGSSVPTYTDGTSNGAEQTAKDVWLTASPSSDAPAASKLVFDVRYGTTAWADVPDAVFVQDDLPIDSLPTVETYGDLFKFDGWYTSLNANKALYDGQTPAELKLAQHDSVATLYGTVKRTNVSWDVTFDPNYTGSDTTKVTVKDGEAAQAPSVERDGYVFAGWYKNGNGDDWASLYDATAPVTEASPKTLYAKWTKTADSALEKLALFGHKPGAFNAYTADSRKAYVKTASELAAKYGVKGVAYDTDQNTVSAVWLNDSDGYRFTDTHVLDNAGSYSEAKAYKDFKITVENLSDAQVEAYTKALTEAQGKLTAADTWFTDVFTGNVGTIATPHSDEIIFVAEKKISTGYADGTFKPTGSMFRQDYAAFLYRLAGSPEYTPAASDNIFSDVTPATPHYKEILWAAKQGIIKGFADGTFRGLALVNRQDAAAFLYRAAGSPEFDASKAAKTFSDVNESTPHYKEVLWAANTVVNYDYDGAKGSTAIIQGFPTGTFDGYATLLRQDGAAFLARTYFYINK